MMLQRWQRTPYLVVLVAVLLIATAHACSIDLHVAMDLSSMTSSNYALCGGVQQDDIDAQYACVDTYVAFVESAMQVLDEACVAIEGSSKGPRLSLSALRCVNESAREIVFLEPSRKTKDITSALEDISQAYLGGGTCGTFALDAIDEWISQSSAAKRIQRVIFLSEENQFADSNVTALQERVGSLEASGAVLFAGVLNSTNRGLSEMLNNASVIDIMASDTMKAKDLSLNVTGATPTEAPTSPPVTGTTSAPTVEATSSDTTPAPTADTTSSDTTPAPTADTTSSDTTSTPTLDTTSAPTSGTPAPSSNPTRSPTEAAETSSPTQDPATNSPTTNPTSATPTAGPSSVPTIFPSVAPTQAPSTTTPTSNPTSQPTNPTESPSLVPTPLPVAGATPSPTPLPTPTPTSAPTTQPTATPTSSPTTSAQENSTTLQPTTAPQEDAYSQRPSNAPISSSFVPTSSPTLTATDSPSEKPDNSTSEGGSSTGGSSDSSSCPRGSYDNDGYCYFQWDRDGKAVPALITLAAVMLIPVMVALYDLGWVGLDISLDVLAASGDLISDLYYITQEPFYNLVLFFLSCASIAFTILPYISWLRRNPIRMYFGPAILIRTERTILLFCAGVIWWIVGLVLYAMRVLPFGKIKAGFLLDPDSGFLCGSANRWLQDVNDQLRNSPDDDENSEADEDEKSKDGENTNALEDLEKTTKVSSEDQEKSSSSPASESPEDDDDLPFDPVAFNRMRLFEVIAESVPQFSLQLANGLLLDSWSIASAVSIGFSGFLILRVLQHLLVYVGLVGKSPDEMPVGLGIFAKPVRHVSQRRLSNRKSSVPTKAASLEEVSTDKEDSFELDELALTSEAFTHGRASV